MISSNKFLVISLENKIECFKDLFDKMPAKRRDRDSEVGGSAKNGQLELLQNDHKMFLQAFESMYIIIRFKIINSNKYFLIHLTEEHIRNLLARVSSLFINCHIVVFYIIQ